MKKLFAVALAGAALVGPATAALADIPQPAGADPCPAGSKGRIVWHYDPVEKDYDYYKLCIYTGP